ncbi:MAG: hypothetical protein L0Z53_15040 [Acidobacteriales bacterium]|nr:hypothetical protein [Terriglobales bacterium]
MNIPTDAEIGGMTDDELVDLQGEIEWEMKAILHKMDDDGNYPSQLSYDTDEQQYRMLEHANKQALDAIQRRRL